MLRIIFKIIRFKKARHKLRKRGFSVSCYFRWVRLFFFKRSSLIASCPVPASCVHPAIALEIPIGNITIHVYIYIYNTKKKVENKNVYNSQLWRIKWVYCTYIMRIPYTQLSQRVKMSVGD